MILSRRAFIKTCAAALVTMGISNGFPLSGKVTAAANTIPVVLYHRVGYHRGALTVTPERLSGDLSRLLGNGYVPVTLQQFENYMFNKKDDLPHNPVLITFDDGYRDNYEYAFPVLQQYGVAATFFVITGMINDSDRLSAEQIREMAKYRMDFGSHTISHQSLAGLPPEKVALELNGSKLALEDILGHPVTALAYPCGSYDATTLRIAGECGYVDAFTVRESVCKRGMSQYELPRIPVFSYQRDVLDRIEA